MYSIEVDFEVFKAITLRRTSEDITPNDVLREMFGLGKKPQENASEKRERAAWVAKGVSFPHGTEFRAFFKGQTHTGIVNDGALIVNGKKCFSPSNAANVITQTSVNGWEFWECKFPGESIWKPISPLRPRGKKP
jgi:hypothetical protein